MNESSLDKQTCRGLQVIVLLILAIVLAVALTVVSWWIISNTFVSEFKPVSMSHPQEQLRSKNK